MVEKCLWGGWTMESDWKEMETKIHGWSPQYGVW